MPRHAQLLIALALVAGLAYPRIVHSQMHPHGSAPSDSTHRHKTPGTPASAPKRRAATRNHPVQRKETPATEHQHATPAVEHHHEMAMAGMYGPYPMTRESSGTAWQPDRAMHRGIHVMSGRWMLMLHGFADVAFDHQGGPRGDEKIFSSNMLMGMAQRSLGPGTLGLRGMVSIEPATIGKEGYPLLLQTGETADGRTPLIDRQHPHDLFMELAAAYSVAWGDRSLFLYAGLPGEPALGPPAFMHRFSGMAIPQAPISHHWLDSSHITFGVLTAGAVVGRLKLETSLFRGREPDENRYDIESAKYDSHSFRISVNPTASWALQASYGRLRSPEQLEPDVDTDRSTFSAIHAADWGVGHWETTFAWGRNRKRPGPILDALAAESAVQLEGKHTFFARAECAEKDELFTETDPRAGRVFDVSQVTVGYRYDFWKIGRVITGLGGLASLSLVPHDLQDAYRQDPASGMIFAHMELR